MQYITDPTLNISNELESIKELTPGDILSYIHSTTQGWIRDVSDGYSDDYSVLTANWERVCECIRHRAGVSCFPAQIVMVNHLDMRSTDKENVFFQKLCDRMTQFGYCVRRAEELQLCPVCSKAIPTEELYNRIVQSESPIASQLPRIWSERCDSCSGSDDTIVVSE